MADQYLKNSIYLYLAQGINLLFPLLIIPVLINKLTLEGFGIVVLVQSIMGYGSTLVDYGYNLIGVRDIGRAESSNQIGEIIGESVCVKSILLILSFSLVLISIFFIPNLIGEWRMVICGWLAVVGYAFYPIWYFQGIEKMQLISIINIFSKLISFSAIILFINSPEHLDFALFLLSLGPLVNAILSWIQILFISKLNIIFPNFKKIIEVFKEGKDIFLSNVIVQVYSNFIIIISAGIFTLAEIGMLGAYLKLRDVANSVIGPVQQAIFPELSRLALTRNVLAVKKLINRALIVLFSLMILVSGSLFIFHDILKEFIFSNQTVGSEIILLVIVFLILPFGGIYSKVLVAYGKMNWIRNTTVISGITTILFSYFLMSALGLPGGLLILALSYGINAAMGKFYTNTILKKGSIPSL